MPVSVVVAALNAASTIQGQLDALSGQDYPADLFEVLICDNGSTDGTREIVRRHVQKDSRFRLVDASARRGSGPARNLGVAESRNNLIAFCDADDIADAGWLSAMVAACAYHDVVAGRVETVSLNPEWTRVARSLPEGIQQGSFLPFAGAGNLAFRREAFLDVGGFDPEVVWLEDVDLSWRLQLAGHTIGFAPDAIVHVRLRRSISGIYTQGLHYGSALAQLEDRYRQLMGAVGDSASDAAREQVGHDRERIVGAGAPPRPWRLGLPAVAARLARRSSDVHATCRPRTVRDRTGGIASVDSVVPFCRRRDLVREHPDGSRGQDSLTSATGQFFQNTEKVSRSRLAFAARTCSYSSGEES